MGYYNPIFVYPRLEFLDDAKSAGVDGLIVVDVPPEADDELCLPAIERGLSTLSGSPPRRPTPSACRPCSPTPRASSTTSRLPELRARQPRPRRGACTSKTHQGRHGPSRSGRFWRTKRQSRPGQSRRAPTGWWLRAALVRAIQDSLDANGKATGKTVSRVLDGAGSGARRKGQKHRQSA